MNVNRLIRNLVKYKKTSGGDKIVYVQVNNRFLDCDINKTKNNFIIISKITNRYGRKPNRVIVKLRTDIDIPKTDSVISYGRPSVPDEYYIEEQ